MKSPLAPISFAVLLLSMALEVHADPAQYSNKANPWSEGTFSSAAKAITVNSVRSSTKKGRALTADKRGPTTVDKLAEESVKTNDSFGMHLAIGMLIPLTKAGTGTSKDQQKATELISLCLDKLKQLSEQEDVLAPYYLGLLYSNGEGVSLDKARAKDCYEKAAALGNLSAMENLGLMYLNGTGVPQNHQYAKECFEEAIKSGNTVALNHLGMMYFSGTGVAQNYRKAKEYFEKALDAEADYSTSTQKLGWMYVTGTGGLQDNRRGAELYNRAGAMYELGQMYEKGQDVPRNYARAKQSYEKGIQDGGDPRAMTGLGRLYESGRGVPRDYRKAKEYYEKAAKAEGYGRVRQ